MCEKKFHLQKIGDSTMYLDSKGALIGILAYGSELIFSTTLKKEREDLIEQLNSENIQFTISETLRD